VREREREKMSRDNEYHHSGSTARLEIYPSDDNVDTNYIYMLHDTASLTISTIMQLRLAGKSARERRAEQSRAKKTFNFFSVTASTSGDMRKNLVQLI
jgi:hypothetical protein